jgi:hypothetical protein
MTHNNRIFKQYNRLVDKRITNFNVVPLRLRYSERFREMWNSNIGSTIVGLRTIRSVKSKLFVNLPRISAILVTVYISCTLYYYGKDLRFLLCIPMKLSHET